MSLDTKNLEELRKLAYHKIQEIDRLDIEFNDPAKAEMRVQISDELLSAQSELFDIESALAAVQARLDAKEAEAESAAEEIAPADQPRDSSEPQRVFRGAPRGTVRRASSGATRGLDTTGIEVTVDSYMKHLPTAFYHLLERDSYSMVTYSISTSTRETKRLRVTSFIEGYTAKAVNTVEVKRGETQVIKQLPTLFPERVARLHEITRATLNIQAEDLDKGVIEEHQTMPIWLLARTTAPRHVRDAVTGDPIDFSRYLAAFVTPNEPGVMKFQRKVAERHHERRLKGYGGDVELQAEAIYNAVKEDLRLVYVHSKVSFDLDNEIRSQRVRLPSESISTRMGNCIDATLLFASLLEGISLNPVIALVPGHAFVGWQTSEDSEDCAFLETTMLQTNEFKDALKVGTSRANSYKAKFDVSGDDRWFQPLVISDLRTRDGITPME